MANPNAQNVAAGKPKVGGGIYRAPLGTALPIDATSVLAAPYVALGYVSEDGLQPTRDTSVEKIKAWGGDVVAALLADESASFEFNLLEVFSTDVNEFVYGAENVTATPATSTAGTKLAVLDKGGKLPAGVFVFDMQYAGKSMRVVLPNGDPVITGEEPFEDGALTAYTVEVEAIKDTNGVRIYRYLENNNKTA